MAEYKLIENDEIVVSETIVDKSTYQKQWLIDEIARLQAILDKF